MMAKIVHGSNFKGVVDYILDKDKGVQIVAHEGLFLSLIHISEPTRH